MDCSPPGFSVHGISQARILEWGCHFLLQGIFLTQGSNPHLLRWPTVFTNEPPGKPCSRWHTLLSQLQRISIWNLMLLRSNIRLSIIQWHLDIFCRVRVISALMPQLKGILAAQGQACAPGFSCYLHLFPTPALDNPYVISGEGIT